jgi:hypothetical protein
MRLQAELHRDVVWYLRNRCTDREVSEFYEQLERVRKEPIKHSEALHDPSIRSYALRMFRFGAHLAAFKLDAAKRKVSVLACRKLRTKPNERELRGRSPPRENEA